jgi:hypothetical protein
LRTGAIFSLLPLAEFPQAQSLFTSSLSVTERGWNEAQPSCLVALHEGVAVLGFGFFSFSRLSFLATVLSVSGLLTFSLCAVSIPIRDPTHFWMSSLFCLAVLLAVFTSFWSWRLFSLAALCGGSSFGQFFSTFHLVSPRRRLL